jgi:2-polyprenyl-6-methoxyphenol hydroxylase-like FAD-dependent oxidoreductase
VPVNGPAYPAYAAVGRPVLLRILAQAMQEAGAQGRLGVTVASLAQKPGAVEAAFSDGTQGIYDLVVGADGVNSKVRELVFADVPAPRFSGQLCWRAAFARFPEVDRMFLFRGPRNKTGFFPISHSEMFLYLTQNMPDRRHLPDDLLHEILREQLTDYGGLVAQARDRLTDPATVNCRPMDWLLVPPPWYRGRVVLIGDAAHCTTPHLSSGAGMAIEDAVVLAELLGEDAPLPDLLARFMARRFERCRLVSETSLKLCQWEQHPEMPGADPIGVTRASWLALTQPI